jgi:Ca2+-binding EF-hand superfamily protein
MDVKQRLIISVNEARKLLGKDGEHLTDEQVEDLILTLTGASSLLLNQNLVPKKPQVKV